MKGFCAKKVPGGKLLKVHVFFKHSNIEWVQLSGDFFLHPEETISAIEKALENVPLPATANYIASKIEHVLKENNAQLVGATPKDIAEAILEAME